MSPIELFDYRLAALLGYGDIDLMKRSMPQRSYLGWQRYFNEEPWGPWRDNYHTALLAREVKRAGGRGGNIGMSQWMYANPVRSQIEAESTLMGTLGAMATKVSPKEAERRLRAARTRRKNKRKKSNDRPGKTSSNP